MSHRFRTVGLAITLAGLSAPGGQAAVHIHVQGFAFSPSSQTVAVGTEVEWDNHDAFTHTVTSDTPGVFNSGSMGMGAEFRHTFDTPGSYPYHCAFHPEMIGTITVSGGSPPSVTITPPSTIAGPARGVFSEDVRGVTLSNFVLRVTGTTPNIAGALSCTNAAGAPVNCVTGAVRSALFRPTLTLVPGQHYTTTVNPAGAPTRIADVDGNSVPATARSFRASRSLEENSPAVRHTWGVVNDTSAAGGSYARERLKSASTSFTFTGTGVAWETIKGPNQGQADVFIDGVFRLTANNYAATTMYGQTYAFSGLSSGTHTLKIVVRGERGNPVGTSTFIAVDGFFVGTTHLTTPSVSYQWQGLAASGASGGRYARSDTSGASFTVTFRGTGVDWVTATGPQGGKAGVYLDNVLRAVVDTYSATTTFGVVKSYTGLTDSIHTLRVRVLRQKRAASTGYFVVTDRIGVH